jgi:hypothetical protein
LGYALLFCALVDFFIFPGDYGDMTVFFQFEEDIPPAGMFSYINLLLIILVFTGILLFSLRFKKITTSIMAIYVCTLILAGAINIIQIQKELIYVKGQIEYKTTDDYVHKFSKTGKNVMVIMLDAVIGGYVPYLFEEKPKLHDSFYGFTWYNNTVTFATYTQYATPALFGGYEYSPLESNKRKDVHPVDKQNEALLLLPRIFIDQGYSVTLTDPVIAGYRWPPDLNVFKDYPQINAENLEGKYTRHWLDKNPYFIYHNTEISEYFINFSFFRLAPPVLRSSIYRDGKWLIRMRFTTLNEDLYLLLDQYSALDVLPDITEISEDEFNHYTAIVSECTHSPTSYMQVPDYIPVSNVTNRGNGPLSEITAYHTVTAAFLLLVKCFDFLKENDVYDNTRIIIVSDHGKSSNNFPVESNIILPDGRRLCRLASLLLVKDFNAKGSLSVDKTFMSIADVPLIALNGIVENPVNPWTGKILKSDKENGIIITASKWDYLGAINGKRLIFDPDKWMHVHTNIFDPENWSRVSDPENLKR